MASLSDAQRAIVAALAQHSSYGYRASSQVVNRLWLELDRIGAGLAKELLPLLEALSPGEREAFLAGRYTTDALKALKGEIDQAAKALDRAIRAEWSTSALALAGYEIAYITEVMGKAVDGLPKVKVPAVKALKAAADRPVFGGQLLDDLLTDIPVQARARIYAGIRQGIGEGQTNAEIIRGLRGTDKLRYQDGLIHRSKLDVERVVRTARNHVSNVAYENTYKALGVKYLVVMATLDGRTSKYCAAMDGTAYEIDTDFPRPPYHYNCRTQLVPSFDGAVPGNRPFVRSLKVRGGYRIGEDGERLLRPASFRPVGDMTKAQRERAGLKVGQVQASTNYGSWLRSQDAAFQREWLGPARYKLYKEGGYDLSRFVDPRGRQYTLQELRRRDADTFKSIFGD
ncbi:phage putative head morphogenesis protein [Alcaligenes faecalis subsp. faecalis NCIB 8687]|nr:phage putative head morphogenesis protein [Alcaligenes faecalis subsp. faecalis NCIB 8687]